jgi:hypothetical protein
VQSPHPQAGLIGFDFYRHVVGQPVRAGFVRACSSAMAYGCWRFGV